MSWLQNLGRKLSGAEAREREAEAERRRDLAAQIFDEQDATDHFDGPGTLARISEAIPDEDANRYFTQLCKDKIAAVVLAALEDRLISPEEDEKIDQVRERYGSFPLSDKIGAQLDAARAQYALWHTPLEPLQVPLLLKTGEWCAHAVTASAYEERERTVRVNYGGPTVRIRIAKGLYYRAGSIQAQRVTQSYQHTFGKGILGATNKRLLWVSQQKSISIPLDKIVMFEPYTDGIKVIKDTGKPLLFVFERPDQVSMVKISRVIEELR